MADGGAIVAAARDLVGVRFRAQGRDPALGVDCVGLVVLALGAGGRAIAVRADYPLRGGPAAMAAVALRAAGLHEVTLARAGDVLLAAPGAGQLHLGVWTGAGLIHADAALRRVVERPGPVPWPVTGIWRY